MLVLDDGLEYDPVAILAYQSHPDGNVFIVRTKEFGKEPQDHPIELERIRAIRFSALDSTDGSPSPRKASIRLHDGTVLQNVPVRSLFYREGTPVFSITPDAAEADGRTMISINQINEMLFAVPDTVPPMYVGKSSLNVSAPDETEAESYSGELDSETPLSQQFLGGGDYVGQEIIGNADLGDTSDSSFSFGSNSNSGNSSKLGNSWALPLIGFGVSILTFLLYVFVTSLVGGIYLYFASKIDGVSDFPIWKSFLAAGALAIFPFISFFLCAQFIPFFGPVLGLIALYFTARAIVMGAMEVMEEKAGQVLWTFLLLQIGVMVGAAYLL